MQCFLPLKSIHLDIFAFLPAFPQFLIYTFDFILNGTVFEMSFLELPHSALGVGLTDKI